MTKNKVVLFVVLIISSFIIYKISNDQDSVDSDFINESSVVEKINPVDDVKVITPTVIKKEEENKSVNNIPVAAKTPEVADVKQDVEQQLNTMMDDTYQEMEKCRKKLKEIIPEEVIEGEAENSFIKTPEDVYAKLNSYFELMLEKRKHLNQFESFIDNNIEKNINYDNLNDKLKKKPFRDCGDFEEHTLLSTVVESIDENNWSLQQKQEMMKFVFGKYKEQLQGRVATMGLAIKIGILDEFMDEGIIPERYAEELKDLTKGIHQSRMEIMNALPADFKETKQISHEDFLNLREREKDEAAKNSRRLLDFIDRVMEGS